MADEKGRYRRACAQLGQRGALASFTIAASGRVVALFKVRIRSPFGYYFLCHPGEADTPRIRALREFLG